MCVRTRACQERCALTCGLCSGGDAPPLATWALREGELVVEARKGTARSWGQLLAAAKPANRILELREPQQQEGLGQLLRCFEFCEAGAGEDVGVGKAAAAGASSGAGAAAAAAGGAARREACRQRCERSDAAAPLSYDGRPPRVAAGRSTG